VPLPGVILDVQTCRVVDAEGKAAITERDWVRRDNDGMAFGALACAVHNVGVDVHQQVTYAHTQDSA
jgi:hypothetical protein